MRPDQLTITVLSKAFRLIPETIFLLSDRGTIAVAEDGIFQDVDDLYTWSVEGEKATVGRGVFIRWNGTVEWNGGMEQWNGIVEWNGGIVG